MFIRAARDVLRRGLTEDAVRRGGSEAIPAIVTVEVAWPQLLPLISP